MENRPEKVFVTCLKYKRADEPWSGLPMSHPKGSLRETHYIRSFVIPT